MCHSRYLKFPRESVVIPPPAKKLIRPPRPITFPKSPSLSTKLKHESGKNIVMLNLITPQITIWFKPNKRAFLDTDVCANVINKHLYKNLVAEKPLVFDSPTSKSQNGIQTRSSICHTDSKFQLAPKHFTGIFLVLPAVITVILCHDFFKKHFNNERVQKLNQ